MRHYIRFCTSWWVVAFTSVTVLCLISVSERHAHAQSTPVYQINCGGPAETPFAADNYSTGGSKRTYTNSVNITGVANAAPEAVYQSARDSGTSFSYTFPSLTSGATYTVRLHFAENVCNGANQRLFNIAINGQSVADKFDIFNSAGAAEKALVTSYTATANTSGNIVLALTAVKSDANLCGVEILSAASLFFPSDQPAPMWGMGVIPTDASANAGGFGPSSGDEVNLASGVYENHPGPDVVVPNPLGPSPVFERMYRSKTAYLGYGSPGLSAGWTHNYDITITGAALSNTLSLTYPNRAIDVLLVGASPGGSQPPSVSAPTGAPYSVQAIQGYHQPLGKFQSITLTFEDNSTWLFTPNSTLSPYFYQLTMVRDSAANWITLSYTGTQLSSIADDTGRVILTIGYANQGYLSGLTEKSDPNNWRSVSYTFNTQANSYCLQKVSQLYLTNNPTDNFTIWTYNYQNIGGQPFLTSVSVPDPNTTTNNPTLTVSNAVNYNVSNGLISSVVDADQNQRTYNYQAATQVQVLNPAGNSVALSYRQGADSLNRATDVTDGKGNTAYAYYSDLLNPFSPTDILNPNNQIESAVYDPFGNVTSESVPCNGLILSTVYTYNYLPLSVVQLQSEQEGSRTPTSYTYYQNNTLVNGLLQPNGLVASVNTPLPGSTTEGPTETTTCVYTAMGNVASVTMPAPASSGTVTITYNYTTDPLGNFQQAEALGEPLTITIPISATTSAVTHYRYNPHGTVSTLIDANGIETDYTYTTQDQLQLITYPVVYPPPHYTAVQYQTRFTDLYDGGPLTETDLVDPSLSPASTTYRSVFPVLGNEDETTAQTGDTDLFTQTLDPDFRPSAIADGDGSTHTTKPYFDQADNLTTVLFPNNAPKNFDAWQGTYDPDGNLTTQTDGLNNITTYNLAPDDSRLQSITYPTGTLTTPVYTYDNLGRLTQRVDASGTFIYEYDELDNLLSTSVTYNVVGTPGVTLPEQTVSYTYYPDGHRQSMTTPQGTYNYTYDLSGRLTEVVFPWTGGSVQYTYDLGGRLTQVTHSKGNIYYTYDNLGRLTDLKNQANDVNATVMSEFGPNMTYDAAGNREFVPVTILPLPGDNNENASGQITYGYEGTGGSDRLVSEFVTRLSDAAWGGDYSYTYTSDAADNLTTLRNGLQTYDADNHLPSGTYPSYDGNGNYTWSNNYTYDIENRLIGVHTFFGDPSISSGYTGEGQRAWKSFKTGLGQVEYTSYFLYDGDQVVCELSYNSTSKTTQVTAAYGYGASGLIQRYADIYSLSQVYTYNFDPSGNLVSRFQQQDPANLAMDITTFDAFGQLLGDLYANSGGIPAPPIDPVGFCGEWGAYTDETISDVYSGLYIAGPVLMTNRFYDPWTARFLTRDPVGMEGGMNLYAYTRNNPVNNADPTGLQADESGVNWDHLSMGAGFKGRDVNKSIHHGAGIAKRIGVFIADCHPWSAICKFIYGKDNEGKKISTAARVGNGAFAAAGIFGAFGRLPWGAIPATGMRTVDLTDSAWRNGRFSWNLVYVLRDKETGELLKVGKTQGTRWAGRFEPYSTAGKRLGRKLVVDVFEITGKSNIEVEKEIRKYLKGLGHELPWDNTDRLLGRPGIGIPR